MDNYHRAEEDGIIMRKYWISTTHSSRTRDWHRDLHNKTQNVDKPFVNSVGKIMYPGDPSAHPSNVYNCRCTLGTRILGFKKQYIQSNSLTIGDSHDIMKRSKVFNKKSNDTSEARIPISKKRFEQLTIEARKNGAVIIQCKYGDEFYMHLERNEATASCIGDVLIFRSDATVSEVLEETYHYAQNINGDNDDKPTNLRIILNEIDAKEYIINNAQKYSVPRKEIEKIKKQLENYKLELNNLFGEG